MPTADHKMLTVHMLDSSTRHKKGARNVFHVHIVAHKVPAPVKWKRLALECFTDHRIQHPTITAAAYGAWPVHVGQTQYRASDNPQTDIQFQIIFGRQFVQVIDGNRFLRMGFVHRQAFRNAPFCNRPGKQDDGLQALETASFQQVHHRQYIYFKISKRILIRRRHASLGGKMKDNIAILKRTLPDRTFADISEHISYLCAGSQGGSRCSRPGNPYDLAVSIFKQPDEIGSHKPRSSRHQDALALITGQKLILAGGTHNHASTWIFGTYTIHLPPTAWKPRSLGMISRA